jgi:predicted RNase H-like HicB family nuclease
LEGCKYFLLNKLIVTSNTYESALSNAKEAIQLWIEAAIEFGDPIPKPKGKRLAYA